MDKIFVKINLLWAGVLTFLTSALGAYWYIFAAFMVLNVADFLTGIAKAKYGNSENSNKGYPYMATTLSLTPFDSSCQREPVNLISP